MICQKNNSICDRKIIPVILLIFILIFPQNAFTRNKSPFDVKTELDVLFFSLSASMLIPTFFATTTPLSQDDINGLNKNHINAFDRSVTHNWNTTAKSWSDITLITCALTPLILIVGKKARHDWMTAALMYAEVLALSFSMGRLVKTLVDRPRPFVYNNNAPLSEKTQVDARHSFFSGHTVTAFSSAAFFSYTFSQYYPNSPWRYVVWPVSFSLAGLTGYLRIAAGKHFPTDVIVGAAVGTLIGILVPYLHKTKKNKRLSITPFMGTKNGINVTYSF